MKKVVELAEYTKKFRDFVEYLVKEKPPVLSMTHRIAITVSPTEISLSHIEYIKENIKVLSSDVLPYTELESVPQVLSEIVKKNEFDTMPAFWLLNPEDYQLFLVESLPVAIEELQDALSWRIRSLITYPIEEATVDYFTMPAKKSAPESPIVAAIVSKTDYLLKINEIFKKSGLKLTTIDIPELAMRNLTNLYEDDEKSTAFLYFYKQSAILNITLQHNLYFTRRINWNTAGAPSSKDVEQICLDLLRYFDYFQSQWRYPSPTRVFIALEQGDSKALAKLISDNLLVQVEPYQLKPEWIEGALPDKYLLACGAVLRKEPSNATRN